MRFLNELKEIIFITLISSNAFASNQMFFHCTTKDGVISVYSIDDELMLTMKKMIPLSLTTLQAYQKIAILSTVITLDLTLNTIGLLIQVVMLIIHYIKILKVKIMTAACKSHI